MASVAVPRAPAFSRGCLRSFYHAKKTHQSGDPAAERRSTETKTSFNSDEMRATTLTIKQTIYIALLLLSSRFDASA
jgi:hypothetical protein